MHPKPGRVSHQMMVPVLTFLHHSFTPLSLCTLPPSSPLHLSPFTPLSYCTLPPSSPLHSLPFFFLLSLLPSAPPSLLCLASKPSTPTRHSSAVAASSTTASSTGGTQHPPPPPTSPTLMHNQERHHVALTAFCTRYTGCWNVTEDWANRKAAFGT